MTKKIVKFASLGLISIVLLISSLMSALAWQDYQGLINPFTVAGKVDLTTVGNVPMDVKVCNQRTGYCDTKKTTVDGTFLIEMSVFKIRDEFEAPWQLGDNVEVTYCAFESGCKYNFRIGEKKADGQRCCGGPVVLALKGPLASVLPEVVVPPVSVEESVVELCKKDPACLLLVEKDPVTKTEYIVDDVSAAELEKIRTKYAWAKGLLAMAVALGGVAGGVSLAKRRKAQKMLRTVVKKEREGQYKK